MADHSIYNQAVVAQFGNLQHGTLHQHAIIIPKQIDDLDLSAYAYRLYCHLARRVAECDGICTDSTRELAQACKMAPSTISEAKGELRSQHLIAIHETKAGHHITLNDVWSHMLVTDTNHSPDDHAFASPNARVRPANVVYEQCSPGEQRREGWLEGGRAPATTSINEEIRVTAELTEPSLAELWQAACLAPRRIHLYQLQQLAQHYGDEWIRRAILSFTSPIRSITAIKATLERWQHDDAWGSDAPQRHHQRAAYQHAQSERTCSPPPRDMLIPAAQAVDTTQLVETAAVLSAGPAAVPPSSAPRDPAVAAYVAAYTTRHHQAPPPAKQVSIQAAHISDLARWQATLDVWLSEGYKLTNVEGLLDRYRKTPQSVKRYSLDDLYALHDSLSQQPLAPRVTPERIAALLGRA